MCSCGLLTSLNTLESLRKENINAARMTSSWRLLLVFVHYVQLVLLNNVKSTSYMQGLRLSSLFQVPFLPITIVNNVFDVRQDLRLHCLMKTWYGYVIKQFMHMWQMFTNYLKQFLSQGTTAPSQIILFPILHHAMQYLRGIYARALNANGILIVPVKCFHCCHVLQRLAHMRVNASPEKLRGWKTKKKMPGP